MKFGVWEEGKFIGVVIFSRGASPWLGKALELDQTEICELTRIAMTKHKTPVSQVVAICLKKFKETNSKMRAVVSFADPKEGHKGGIYQAGNWIYTGQSGEVTEYFVDGRWRHKKGVWNRLVKEKKQGKNLPVVEGGEPVPWRDMPGKFRYIYPLDKAMRRKVTKLALDFPHAVEGLTVSRPGSAGEVQVQSLATARKGA